MTRAFRTRNRFFWPFAAFLAVMVALEIYEQLVRPAPGWLRLPVVLFGFVFTLLWAWEAERPLSKPGPESDQGTPIKL